MIRSRRVAVRTYAAVYTLFAAGNHLHAQTARDIPIRTLAPSTAVSTDSVGPVLVVRALSNGNVLVNDYGSRRVVLFDATLRHSRIVIDTIGGGRPDAPMRVTASAGTLIPYLGDSSLYADRLGKSFFVLDAEGKVARVMSIPRPSDIAMLSAGDNFGNPGFDSKGRLVYRGAFAQLPPKRDPDHPWIPPLPVQRDSAPIVRADLDTRTIDTLSALRVSVLAPLNKVEIDNAGNVLVRTWLTPFDIDDQWTLLSDGTVAVLSIHDYHIDWTDPDGTHRSTAKMPFDWRPLTAEDKQRVVDSLRPAIERFNSGGARTLPTPNGPRTLRQQFALLPPEQFPDFVPPVQAGTVKADLDARLWILPRTSLSAKGGLLYDIVNRNGEIVERVQFPPGYVLAGFGAHRMLYVVHITGRKGTLESTTVK